MQKIDLEAVDLDIATDMVDRLSLRNLEAVHKHIVAILKEKFGKEGEDEDGVLIKF